ncbi:MAG: CapA family protein [Oscillochloridaceae bacterium]|nr:CapA family protein [Chloroflexaceae bacterium]MDW8390864.1 CapA family protein [Oscillochloridaceae bacterium]
MMASRHIHIVALPLLVGILAALAGACAARPAALPDLRGWQTLYIRPGWTGGATLDLRAVGDVMLARGVARTVERQGAAALLADSRSLLAGDLTLGNLESPLTTASAPARPGPYRLLAAPAHVAALRSAGFDLLGLANNHALDAGPEGLAETLATLREAGMAAAGAGQSEAAALAPVMLKARGLRVAVLAFNDVRDPADERGGLAPADDRAWPNPDFAGCAPGAEPCPHGRAWLSARALKAVAAARADADAVVALVHWGMEYAAEPGVRQRAWAARLVAAGADLVLGAHSHVLQPVETLARGERAGIVAYSLGDFLFDGPANPALSSGAVLRALLDDKGVALLAVAPVATAGGRPYPLAPESAAWRAALEALGGSAPSPAETPAMPAPVQTPAQPGATSVWRWDGASGQPVTIAAALAPHPVLVPADLRGDGEPLWAELDAAGVVTLRDGPGADAPVVWRNERPAWRITRVLAGDPNDDGRAELLLLLWQPDEAGRLRSQPYLLGWRGGRFRIIWGGSAPATPVQDLAWADLDGDGRGELVALEGGAAPGDAGEHVSVWRWHGWGFQLEWRSAAGRWRRVGLEDLDGDRRFEILAAP